MTKVRCKNCGDIIESDGRGKWVQCSCKKVYVDETEYYCRIGGNFEDWEIVEDVQDNNKDEV